MSVVRARSRWGYTKHRRIPAVAAAVPLGLLLALAGGWLAVLSGVAGSHPLWGFWIFAAFLAGPCMALAYVLVVDRNSVEGAVDRPEESAESQWYNQAATGSFMDLLLVLGAGSTVLAFTPVELAVDVKLLLPAVLVLAYMSFGIRYLVIRRKA